MQMSLRIVVSGACGHYSGAVIELGFAAALRAAVALDGEDRDVVVDKRLCDEQSIDDLIAGILAMWPKTLNDTDSTSLPWGARDFSLLHRGRMLKGTLPLSVAFPEACDTLGDSSKSTVTELVHLVFRRQGDSLSEASTLRQRATLQRQLAREAFVAQQAADGTAAEENKSRAPSPKQRDSGCCIIS